MMKIELASEVKDGKFYPRGRVTKPIFAVCFECESLFSIINLKTADENALAITNYSVVDDSTGKIYELP
jgi:hypothetical protein